MKYTKKILALLLALTMVFAMAVSVGAQDVTYSGEDAGSGSITISNASKGETYSVYKLFGAVLSDDNSSISYTGDIPESLNAYFEVDTAGNIVATAAATSGNDMSDGLKAALKAWCDDSSSAYLATAKAEETQLVFKNLPYGYYVVKTTQGNAAVSVTSTKPNASVTDKNTTQPTLDKSVDGTSYSIGDTITYTLKFKTANFDGEAKITEYVIEDTLPDFLSSVTVTKITIDGTEYTVNDQVPQFDNDKKITFSWVDDQGNHKYNNGAEVVITYTATLTEKAKIGVEGNENTAKLTYDEKTLTDTEKIYSYSFDVVKTKNDNSQLTGAQFELYDAKTNGNKIGLVKEEDGIYRVATADEKSAEDFESAVIVAGKATIKGLKTGTYYLQETKAPDGYNKLTERAEVKISDANNNATLSESKYVSGGVQVVNNAGTELPSTGGMGTTIFYVLGSILVLAAVVLLVTKKRMSAENR